MEYVRNVDDFTEFTRFGEFLTVNVCGLVQGHLLNITDVRLG